MVPQSSGFSSEPHLESWSTVSEWVLGSSLGLWQEVFHLPFVARAKQLIELHFQQVCGWGGKGKGAGKGGA